ncbi:hypothetical protein Syun_026271 [Stephania yunnanensis]|uniref:Uncharacterized protein n=1 Tax=Stephania yunnanensis TaxID=152371 RepID=A0AAP0HWJ3_9MAGN
MGNSYSVLELIASLILIGMVNTASTTNLLLFYSEEWKLFHHLIRSMNKDASEARRIMSLWICLEEFGYYALIRKIGSLHDQIVEAVFEETTTCLACIEHDAQEPTSIDDTPLLARLAEEPLDRRFFYYNREILRGRFKHFMNSVCNIIFRRDDIDLAEEFATLNITLPFGESSTTQVDAADLSLNSSTTSYQASTQGNQRSMTSYLFPFVRSFGLQLPPREQRSLFVTFSRGYPVSKEEILEFFTLRWGQVVEDITLEQTAGDIMPQYGTVVLKDPSVIPMILNGKSKARFFVNGKHLWTRVYVPKRNGDGNGNENGLT